MMSDLISRQAAIDAIMGEPTDAHYPSWYAAQIEKLPAAQPEIIRCKDCKHRYLDGMIWNCPFGLSGGEDFFCAYGAKEGDSDDERFNQQTGGD